MKIILSRNRLFEGVDDDDLRRERVRGVFAVGAIAVLFYLRQVNENRPFTLIPAIVPSGLAITGDVIMVFWGLYVLLTAMALAVPNFVGDFWWKRIAHPLLRAIYGVAKVFYAVAVIFLLVAFVYFAAQILWAAPVIGILIVLVVISETYSSLRNWFREHRRSKANITIVRKS